MKRTIWKTMFEGLFTLIFIWMLIGCASQSRPSKQRPEFYVHNVLWAEETISVIAQWYTGNHNNWEHIVKANYDLDPKKILIGDKILIPVALLKTREPMPRKYLENSVRKKDTPSLPRKKTSIESDKKEVVLTTETDQQTVEIDEIELFQLQDTERFAEEFDEIELFQPQDIEQTVGESGEVELFQPVE